MPVNDLLKRPGGLPARGAAARRGRRGERCPGRISAANRPATAQASGSPRSAARSSHSASVTGALVLRDGSGGRSRRGSGRTAAGATAHTRSLRPEGRRWLAGRRADPASRAALAAGRDPRRSRCADGRSSRTPRAPIAARDAFSEALRPRTQAFSRSLRSSDERTATTRSQSRRGCGSSGCPGAGPGKCRRRRAVLRVAFGGFTATLFGSTRLAAAARAAAAFAGSAWRRSRQLASDTESSVASRSSSVVTSRRCNRLELRALPAVPHARLASSCFHSFDCSS